MLKLQTKYISVVKSILILSFLGLGTIVFVEKYHVQLMQSMGSLFDPIARLVATVTSIRQEHSSEIMGFSD